eukprot:CAMPEP_0113673256 /NCGR_PEP_ID=MMETSP0038_2-20120614/6753_1 /TAXON_ID=2898 /ORGANISM="Cryptomonas paramecium" /LENGTH=184 /DNA_ID=CAMNT_0000589687 /DNA_START=234 /DNA_END=788 /DNA_ORIENTATION=- /assembly_acc=CAM_ASM_000170
MNHEAWMYYGKMAAMATYSDSEMSQAPTSCEGGGPGFESLPENLCIPFQPSAGMPSCSSMCSSASTISSATMSNAHSLFTSSMDGHAPSFDFYGLRPYARSEFQICQAIEGPFGLPGQNPSKTVNTMNVKQKEAIFPSSTNGFLYGAAASTPPPGGRPQSMVVPTTGDEMIEEFSLGAGWPGNK